MNQKTSVSRRNFLKGSAVVAGASTFGFVQLFGYDRLTARAQEGDSVELMLNLAATAETLACTHYHAVLTDSNIALTPAEVSYLKSALDTELQHLEFLNANKARSVADEFYFPRNVYTDRDQFSMITEQAEMAFVAAYLASVRRIAELGNPLLAATAAQVAVTEQVHLALIRQIGGRVPNHVSLGQALFMNTSEALPVLQGFLEGGADFAGPRKFPGAEAIRSVVNTDGVMPVKPFVDPTLFAK
ncbi:MAG: ferritin-like domain-containing protein [Anaerolineae bacterium]|nr:ferritin-like domain-containing protein [Anaerolineae bacterium]